VRDNEVAAELAGIGLGRARISAFMVSAAAAGAAGAVMAFSVRLAAPSGFTLTLSLTLLTAVVLGGLGSLTGALIGAALLTFLPDVVSNLGRDAGLSDIQAAQLAPLVYGLVMVAVVLLAPLGIVGTLRSLRERTARPPRRTTTSTARTGAVTTSKGEAR
jgi:branched-chain amino acid transport system permease protein